jgi:hypothetical protein
VRDFGMEKKGQRHTWVLGQEAKHMYDMAEERLEV